MFLSPYVYILTNVYVKSDLFSEALPADWVIQDHRFKRISILQEAPDGHP